MLHLEGIADKLNVRIEHHDHLPRGRWGEYRHHPRVIRLLSCLGPVQYRSTLAHEVGHAVYGHRWSTSHTELEADAWAARHLIDPVEWAMVTAAHTDLLTVAAELQVMPKLAAVYAKYLAKHPSVRAHP